MQVAPTLSMISISIHAPAKGATRSRSADIRSRTNFNPRSREGSDALGAWSRALTYIFQSTLPRRERHTHFHLTMLCRIISIHAPAKGATYLRYQLYQANCISIHAPAKGATFRHSSLGLIRHIISIHAPAKGATSCVPVHAAYRPTISIHAPAKGATRPLGMIFTKG